MKNRARKGNMGIKKWGFGGKKQVIGLEKLRAGDQNRKVKWCKMQVVGLKIDRSQEMKGKKKWLFTYFLTCIFSRTERKLEWYCKIKDSDLSF